MLVWIEQFLVRYPELALFLVIAALSARSPLRGVREGPQSDEVTHGTTT